MLRAVSGWVPVCRISAYPTHRPTRLFTSTAKVMTWTPASSPYPSARRDENASKIYKSETNKEVVVQDPYVWLHEPPSKSEETAKFVKEQADYTAKYLEQNKDIPKLKELITQNWSYPRFSPPKLQRNGRYYYLYNSGLQAQNSIYSVAAKDLKPDPSGGPEGELFFDANLLSEDGTAAISVQKFSRSGKYFAYGISRSGSDWVTIYIRSSDSPHDPNKTKGKDHGQMDDLLRFVKFSAIEWTPDDKGFFYQRYPEVEDHGDAEDDKAGTGTEQDLYAKLWYHQVGTPQSEDILILEDPEHPSYMFHATVTLDGRWLLANISKDTGRTNKLWVTDLHDPENPMGPNMKWHKITDEFKSDSVAFHNDGTRLYIKTNADASNDRIVTYDVNDPDKGFVEHIPEDPEARLTDIHITNKDKAILVYSRDVNDELWMYDLPSGKKLKRIGGDMIASIGYVGGLPESDEFWTYVSGFDSPGQIYQYKFTRPEGQEYSLYRSTEVANLKPEDFKVQQVFYESKDGTKVPMFIVTPFSIKHDGTAAAICYGYGGFNIPITPFFSPSVMTFIKSYGLILAVPNLRGGGEYGDTWHEAGMHEKKQNVFDDATAAIKYLVDNKYAAPKKVVISGGSNGGLLVGACVNQAPDLIGAGVADVGVMDMLNFHRFTIGSHWQADYGNPDDPHDFDYIYKYSPLHNVDPSKVYPPVMLLTGDHDDRVVPLHSFKLAATLQHELPKNVNPLLLRVDLKAGHGAGKSTMARIQEATDKWGFVAQALGLKMH